MTNDDHTVAAYLYLHLGEQMPSEDCTVEEFDAWARGSDSFASELAQGYVRRFVDDVSKLLDDILLEASSENPDYMFWFYEAAKRTFDGDKSMIRTWFQWLYLIVFGRPEGPRWGEFVNVLGPRQFVTLVETRFQNLIP